MKRNSRIERLARKEEKATINRTVYLTILSLIIGVLFFTAGIPLLGKLADFTSSIFKNKSTSNQAAVIPTPPSLDNLPQATNSATLKVTGFSSDGAKAEIFLNDQKVKTVDISSNRFEVDDLTLKDGQNNISAKAVSDTGGESNSSSVETVTLQTKEPKLQINTPSDGQSFSGNNRILISGSTDTDNQVFANGFLASINSSGQFTVYVPVPEGDSTITIKASDSAGNTKVVTLKVHFSK